MSVDFVLDAELRDDKGKGASRRLRNAGKTPAIIYGGGAEPKMIELDHNALYHALKKEAFHSSILDIGCGAGAWTMLLAQQHRRVVGIDMSPNMLLAARTQPADMRNVELIEGNALLAPIEGTFDGGNPVWE